MRQPKLLMLDSPRSGSPVVVDQVLEVLQRLRKGGTTILLVERWSSAPSTSPTRPGCCRTAW